MLSLCTVSLKLNFKNQQTHNKTNKSEKQQTNLTEKQQRKKKRVNKNETVYINYRISLEFRIQQANFTQQAY